LKVSPPREAKKFDVQFDPSRVTVAQMLAAVQGLGDGQAATRVAVVGTDAVVAPTPESQVAEGVTGNRELSIPIRIAEKASAGEQTVTVRITFQNRKGDKSEAEQTVELRVPVVVQ
jgi:hypothetical protein